MRKVLLNLRQPNCFLMALDIFQKIYDRKKPQWRYKIGISLRESPVKVYREVVVPSNIRLPHLAELLIRTVGWVGYHLYEFKRGDDLYTSRDEIREYKRWAEPEELESFIQWLPEGFDPHNFNIYATRLRIVDFFRVVRTFTERY